MNKENYQIWMEEEIRRIPKGQVPKLLLHSCCGPCSTYCLEYLSRYFSVTVLYYNPNIYPEEEYHMRVREQERFINEFPALHPISFMEGRFAPNEFYHMAKGYESAKEGGERCFRCYRLRLEETAKIAKEGGYDYFTTTLSISPLKNSAKLNEIGRELERQYGCKYLCSDFKKKNGYKRSTELSNEYHMYRRYYCGCIYSKNQRDQEIKEKELLERSN